MAKTWTIVIFTDEDTVEAVPSSWLINNKCYWPSLPLDKLTAAIRNHEEPNTCWPSYPVRILRHGTFGKYIYSSSIYTTYYVLIKKLFIVPCYVICHLLFCFRQLFNSKTEML